MHVLVHVCNIIGVPRINLRLLAFQMALHTVQDVLLAFSLVELSFRTPLEAQHEQLESTRLSKVVEHSWLAYSQTDNFLDPGCVRL